MCGRAAEIFRRATLIQICSHLLLWDFGREGEPAVLARRKRAGGFWRGVLHVIPAMKIDNRSEGPDAILAVPGGLCSKGAESTQIDLVKATTVLSS
jgi:hypothetical protein